nr:heat shock protein 90-5, chloroplastic [Tanacetum cinerariifolium]
MACDKEMINKCTCAFRSRTHMFARRAYSTKARRAADLLYETSLISGGFTPDSRAELGGKIYEMMAVALGGRWGSVEESETAEPTEDATSEATETEVVEPSEEEDGEVLKRAKLLNQLKTQLLRPPRLKLWSHQKLERKPTCGVLDRVYNIIEKHKSLEAEWLSMGS